MEEFLEFCAKNDCWPDVQTWHQLDDGEEAFERYPNEIAEYRSLAKKLKMPESTIVINEYATMEGCGVPGILIRYIANMEENKVVCLPALLAPGKQPQRPCGRRQRAKLGMVVL